MSTRGTALERAIALLDDAFARLPAARRRALALAMYRAWPAVRQYVDDIDGLFTPEMNDAAWKIFMALVFVLPRGKEHTIDKLVAAVRARAPTLSHFGRVVAAACDQAGAPPPLPLPEEHDEAHPQELPEPTP